MQGTCHHGLPAADCLICRSLGAPTAGQPVKSRKPWSQPQATPNAQPEHKKGSFRVHATGVVLAIVAIGLIAWVVVGAVFALLHVVELIVVAAVAAWVGYRIGMYRGSRRPHQGEHERKR